MGFSVDLRNALLDHYFGKSVLTPPENYFLALVTAGGNEPSSGGYARVSTAPADWNAAVAGVITNLSAITFPTPTGSWGSITKAKLFEVAENGTEKAVGDLPYARDVTSITPAPVFAPGSLRMVLT
jgi:hypothetical protein